MAARYGARRCSARLDASCQRRPTNYASYDDGMVVVAWSRSKTTVMQEMGNLTGFVRLGGNARDRKITVGIGLQKELTLLSSRWGVARDTTACRLPLQFAEFCRPAPCRL